MLEPVQKLTSHDMARVPRPLPPPNTALPATLGGVVWQNVTLTTVGRCMRQMHLVMSATVSVSNLVSWPLHPVEMRAALGGRACGASAQGAGAAGAVVATSAGGPDGRSGHEAVGWVVVGVVEVVEAVETVEVVGRV